MGAEEDFRDETWATMPAFIAGLLLLFLVLQAIRAFGRVTPTQVAQWMRRGGFFMILVGGIYLLFAGRLSLFSALTQAFRSRRSTQADDEFFDAQGSAGKRRASVARTAWIYMRLDLDGGSMEGRALEGPYAGREFSALSRSENLKLYELCRREDPDGARLLEAYLDRRFAGWRQADQGQGEAGSRGGGGSGAMTRDEAYEVLGLPKGAPTDEIVRAHRSLMKKLHPDHGGSTALAARVNQAKDVLLDRHG
jgi:hypothetical protein